VRVQIIARDDDSTDGTQAELLRFSNSFPLEVLLSPHGSGSAAQNFLTLIRTQAAAEFDFIALSDQDDIWYPQKLAQACQKIVEEAASGYSSATLAVWEGGKQVIIKPSGPQNRSDYLFEGAGQGCTFVLTSSLYERIRRFLLARTDLTGSLHFHDWAIYALARVWGLRWVFDPRPSMIYRQHADNDTGARGSLRSATKRLGLVRSGWYRRQLQVICALCTAAAPDNNVVTAWLSALQHPPGLHRKLQLLHFCLQGGRRRRRDNLVVVTACLAGWI
jgi:rhamnosyltransferase